MDRTERVTLGQFYRFCPREGHCRAPSGSLQQVPPALCFCVVVRMCQSQAPSVSIRPSPGGHQLVFCFLGRGPTPTHSRAPLRAPGGPGLQGPAVSPHAIVFRETVGLGAGAGLVLGEGRWLRSLRLHPRGSCRVGLWGSGGVLTPTPVFREWGRPGPDPAALPGEGLGGQPIPPGHRAGEWGAPGSGAEGWGCQGGGADAEGPHSARPCWEQGDVAALEGGEPPSRPSFMMGACLTSQGPCPHGAAGDSSFLLWAGC